MSTTNHEKAQRRHVSNAMYLTKLMAKNGWDGSNPSRSAALTRIEDLLFAKVNEGLKQLGKPHEAELREMVTSICTVKADDKDNEYYEVDRQARFSELIKFNIACTNPWLRKIAANLVRNPAAKQGNSKSNYKATETVLFSIYAIGYLNRKLCVICEQLAERDKSKTVAVEDGVLAKGGDKPAADEVLPFLNIWCGAQRVRSSSFDVCFVVEDSDGTTIAQLMGKFSSAQRGPMCPFNKAVHRQREQGSLVANNERFMLSIGAGGAKTAIAKTSTLGLVQRALGLPERCDISGTTTDAVGAAIMLREEHVRKKEKDPINPHLFVLANIVSMCLQGHHSLSEMIGAASLWSSEYYNPLYVWGSDRVINGIQDHKMNKCRGQETKILDVDRDEAVWLLQENFAISGAGELEQGESSTWDFSDENWRVWKMFANVWNSEIVS